MTQPLSRRDFLLKLSQGAIALPFLLETFQQSLFAQGAEKPILWLQEQHSGLHSAGRFFQQQLGHFLEEHFLFYNPYSSLRAIKAGFILILEGAFAVDRDESFAPLKNLFSKARVVILLGNEASYSAKNMEGYLNVEQEFLYPLEVPFIRIPGEPAQSFHLLGVLNHLLLYGFPQLDEYRRPSMFFKQILCDHCDKRKDLENGHFASFLGDPSGCLFTLGCKGLITKNTCASHKWDLGEDWCLSVGHPCTGCSNPEYPDNSGLGLFGQIQGDRLQANANWVQTLETLGAGALGVTTLGVITHAISRQSQAAKEFTPKLEDSDSKDHPSP